MLALLIISVNDLSLLLFACTKSQKESNEISEEIFLFSKYSLTLLGLTHERVEVIWLGNL